ncbi:MAG: T9SS type A sorting domain-containing protein [Paludibacter sp.]|nr:T9SS type A sorting domain-containing protein [Paludibacter sp.]
MRKITSFKTAFLAIMMMAFVINVSAVTNVATIGALRTANSALAWGVTSTETFTITGEVFLTFVSTSAAGVKTLYVQDATGALMVYDSGKLITNTYNLLDGMTNLTGTLKNYNGMFELILNAAPAAASSTGHAAFAPVVLTLDNLVNYPGQVVTVKNVTISDIAAGTGVFVAAKNYPLSVGGVTSTTVVRTSYADVNYIGAVIPTTAPQNITGLVLPYQANATAAFIVDLIPRTLSDFTVSTGFATPKVDALSVSLSGQTLNVKNVTDGSTVDVYSSLGSKVQTSKLENNAIQLNNLSKGMYVVRVGNMTSKIMM